MPPHLRRAKATEHCCSAGPQARHPKLDRAAYELVGTGLLLAQQPQGQIDALDLTLLLLREKQATAEHISANSAANCVVDLGMPGIAAGARK